MTRTCKLWQWGVCVYASPETAFAWLQVRTRSSGVGCSAACAAKRSDLIWTARWTDYLSHHHHHHYRRGASFGLRIRYAGVISVIHLIWRVCTAPAGVSLARICRITTHTWWHLPSVRVFNDSPTGRMNEQRGTRSGSPPRSIKCVTLPTSNLEKQIGTVATAATATICDRHH